eukprot:m.214967 g.214967  ORF g.214967 m.214967 type:complete len:117 (-) comp19082_c0_seq19:184-534(-)
MDIMCFACQHSNESKLIARSTVATPSIQLCNCVVCQDVMTGHCPGSLPEVRLNGANPEVCGVRARSNLYLPECGIVFHSLLNKNRHRPCSPNICYSMNDFPIFSGGVVALCPSGKS